MRNMKNSILEEPLIHLIIWIRNDDVMNEQDDEVEGSRRSLPTKRIKDKYLIVISWYCFVIHLIIFSWCVMHDRLVALMTVVRYGWMLCWLNSFMMHNNLLLCICFSSNHATSAFELYEMSCTTAYKKRGMRLVPKNKWWQFNKHESKAPRLKDTFRER